MKITLYFSIKEWMNSESSALSAQYIFYRKPLIGNSASMWESGSERETRWLRKESDRFPMSSSDCARSVKNDPHSRTSNAFSRLSIVESERSGSRWEKTRVFTISTTIRETIAQICLVFGTVLLCIFKRIHTSTTSTVGIKQSNASKNNSSCPFCSTDLSTANRDIFNGNTILRADSNLLMMSFDLTF